MWLALLPRFARAVHRVTRRNTWEMNTSCYWKKKTLNSSRWNPRILCSAAKGAKGIQEDENVIEKIFDIPVKQCNLTNNGLGSDTSQTVFHPTSTRTHRALTHELRLSIGQFPQSPDGRHGANPQGPSQTEVRLLLPHIEASSVTATASSATLEPPPM